MADVTRRGQLILVAALTMAVTFVALALLLNTAIFAENLATRESGGLTAQAAASSAAVNAGVNASLFAVTQANDDNESRETLATDLETVTGNWSTDAGRHLGADGSSVEVDLTATTNGTRIAHVNGSRAWTSAGGDGNWTLYEGVDAADHRWFVLNVSRSELPTMSLDDNMSTVVNDSFTVELTSDTFSTTRRLHVFRGTGTDNVYVLVESGTLLRDASGTYVDHVASGCVARSDQVTIEVWDGEVDGRDCEALSIASVFGGPVTVRYENATAPDGTARVGGTYSVLLAVTSLDRSSFHNASTSGDSPFTAWAVTDATVRRTVRDGTVNHTDTEQVAATWLRGTAPGGDPVVHFGVNDSSAGSDVQYEVNWQVRDAGADLEWVNVTVEDGSGTVKKEVTHAVSGSTAGNVDAYACTSGCASSHTITVTAKDTDGNVVTVSQDHDPDGDNDEVTVS